MKSTERRGDAVKQEDREFEFLYHLSPKAGYTLLEFWSYNIYDERGHEQDRLDETFIVDKIRNALASAQ